MFQFPMYTVPEDDPGSVPLCVDIGVEITEPITYTITTAQKSPPEAEGTTTLTHFELTIIIIAIYIQVCVDHCPYVNHYRE